MQLHLVGGFLGSGKTTAILSAARKLVADKKTVGIITNDQGKYLVDTGFFRLSDLPTVEVTGGCFCCHYDDLNKQMADLIEKAHPQVIFAESVGSCADLVATVIKPMLSLNSKNLTPTSFSVFADSRLLRLFLMGEALPFADEIVYIFAKQLEEADLVVINKVDLLDAEKLADIVVLFQKKFPDKTFLLQNSLAENGTDAWLQVISSHPLRLPDAALDIDYQNYGKGEIKMAWLDESVTVPVHEHNGRVEIKNLLQKMAALLHEQNVPIGHLKFLVSDGINNAKVSLTTLEQPGWLDSIPELCGSKIDLIINGRVQMKAADFKTLVAQALALNTQSSRENYVFAYHPGFPNPTHRYSKVQPFRRN